MEQRPCVLVAHPSPDLYGSDRQLLASLAALPAATWRVLVVLPADGPLAAEVRALGHEVRVLPFPVLRKAFATPAGLLRLAGQLAVALPRLVRLLRRERVAALYVNTITLPVWLLAGRLARVRALCHVHEAEVGVGRAVGLALYGPLVLAGRLVANSAETARVVAGVVPRLAARTVVVHNGVDRPVPVRPRAPHAGPSRLVVVGRLSQRKGTDVAVEVARLLLARGRDVHLTLVGDVFPGYEPFADGLRATVAREGLGDRVALTGFADDVWPAYDAADVVLVPSLGESFGNVAVEAVLSERPVVASGVQGLAEVLDDGRTALLVPPGDAAAAAAAVEELLDDPARADALGRAARADALARFGGAAYRAAVLREVSRLAGRGAA